MPLQLIEHALIEAADTLAAFDILKLEHGRKARPDHAALVALKLEQIASFAALLETELLRRYGAAPVFH